MIETFMRTAPGPNQWGETYTKISNETDLRDFLAHTDDRESHKVPNAHSGLTNEREDYFCSDQWERLTSVLTNERGLLLFWPMRETYTGALPLRQVGRPPPWQGQRARLPSGQEFQELQKDTNLAFFLQFLHSLNLFSSFPVSLSFLSIAS